MPFRLSILSDEISDDFDHALDLASAWGLELVELRTLWGKNVVDLDRDEIDRTRLALERRALAVECIASPAYKCSLRDEDAPAGSSGYHAARTQASAQIETLERGLAVAEALGARVIRGFSFWRLPYPNEAQHEIAAHLRQAASSAAARGRVLAIENEHTCNAATGTEVASLLAAVNHPSCKIIWDPANARMAGERAFPDGYRAVKGAIANVHLKDCVPTGGAEPWRVLGEGEIDWCGQLATLVADGYDGPLTLEPHPVKPYSREKAAYRSLQALRQILAQVEYAGMQNA